MSFQAIRKFFEMPIKIGIATVDPTIKVLTDNELYTDDDADTDFVLVRLNFGATQEPTFCGPVERLRGSLVIEIFTRKGQGPGRGQRIAAEVMKELNKMPRHLNDTVAGTVSGGVNSITGPSFSALDGRPHFFTRLSCSIQAAYS